MGLTINVANFERKSKEPSNRAVTQFQGCHGPPQRTRGRHTVTPTGHFGYGMVR